MNDRDFARFFKAIFGVWLVLAVLVIVAVVIGLIWLAGEVL